MINGDATTPIDERSIPSGKIVSVSNTVFDFQRSKRIGDDIRQLEEQFPYGNGYDHNWVLNKDAGCSLVADVNEPESGRRLRIYSTAPGVQFYTGNHLDGSTGGKGRVHTKHSGFCLEPQAFPNSPNQSQKKHPKNKLCRLSARADAER